MNLKAFSLLCLIKPQNTKARNRTILWWTLNLAYIKEDGDEDFKSVFDGETFENKLNSYDEIEEGEEYSEGGEKQHFSIAVKKFAYFISFWYSGQATDKEGFDAADELLKEVDIFNINNEEENRKPNRRYCSQSL